MRPNALNRTAGTRLFLRKRSDNPVASMLRALALLSLIGVQACALRPQAPLDDAPEARQVRVSSEHYPDSYDQALRLWRSPEQVNAWIADSFEYDRARAMRLSETQRQAHGSLPIYPPTQFYSTPAGVCVDLTRFAVETLRAISPEANPKYVMLEFAPVTIQGNTLRVHWLASFERDGKLYFFADSKRPGYIAGPYSSTHEFVAEYARYRDREVIAFRELPSYQRQVKVKTAKQIREGA